MRKTRTKPSKVLTVRLDPKVIEELLHESAIRKLSTSELVRELINDHQHQDAKTADTREELRQLRGELGKHRREFAIAMQVVLSHAGKVTKEKSREWVRKTLEKWSE